MRIVTTILMMLVYSCGFAQERPNILWLVCEDMSPYLRSYGNTLVETPNLDKMASEGILFTRAHSNAPQCSPSRSTLISGKYAVSLGTDIHREKRPVPKDFYFPIYLRKAGYYCTNNSKKDYNDRKTPADVWDESSKKATYLNRPDKSKPFFAVFNSGITHMTRVATRTVAGRRPRSVDMEAVEVPSYIPDLPEVRNDIAWHMDAVMLMDQWIGGQLEALRRSGEAENTIIFFYSDHGGTVPRGKAYLYESGTHVPLIAFFPEKWRHLAKMPIPSISDRLVSFVDFSATVLNMAGVDIPDFMVGKPFFGPGADKNKNENEYIFTFRANQGEAFIPSRAVTDGDFKLIWNYQSAYPNGSRQNYQWQMPAQQAWDIAYMKNDLNPLTEKFWLPVEPFELYDLRRDPWETKNLAGDRAYAKKLNELQTVLKDQLRGQNDLGFIPRYYRQELQKNGPLYHVVQKLKIDVDKHIEAAETASLSNLSNLPVLIDYLDHNDPVVQYWGASGICGLAKKGLVKALPEKVSVVMDRSDVIPEVKCMLAEAMVYAGDAKQGLRYLMGELKKNFGPAAVALQNTGDKARPIAADLKALLENSSLKGKQKFYVRSTLINCEVLPYSELYH